VQQLTTGNFRDRLVSLRDSNKTRARFNTSRSTIARATFAERERESETRHKVPHEISTIKMKANAALVYAY